MADVNESAFAVYTGKSTLSKSQKRRKKNKEGKKVDSSLNKAEKLELILKKKNKKNKILAKSLANGDDVDKSTKKNKEKKLEKKLFLDKSSNTTPKEKKKKKKVKPPKAELAIKALKNPNTNFENSMEHEYNNQDHNLSESDRSLNPANATYNITDKNEKKIKKKVQISSNLPESGKKGLNKVVVSTPRFQRKADSSKETSNLSRNNVLNAVDSYIQNKKTKILSPENSSKDKKLVMYKALAKEAKQRAEIQGSGEAFGEATLQKVLDPVSVEIFLRDYWEKKPLHIPGKEDKFASFISTEVIDSILRENIVIFGKHIDVTTYTNGVRETHNPEGRAHAHVVWDFYSNDCSVRMLNPQYFLNSIHLLNANLQELFGCFVGANVYLTPPNSQGFAPHYDDIEAIILQVEGSKIWKIYPPINKEGYLPRFSSRNLTEEEIGEPMMELTLKAGDVLYFPRGFIHQGRTGDQHSLHITLSTYQQTSWFNLLEKALPLTLNKACKQDVEFRKGLPLGYLESGGFAYKSPSQQKKHLVNHLKQLMHRMVDFLEVDEAMDCMGLKFIQEALPPVLTPREAACSVVGGGLRMTKQGKLSHHIMFPLDTRIRWIRKNCFRILEEDVTLENDTIEKQVRIYYTLDNSKEYRKEEPQFLIIPPAMVPAVLHLVTTYPEYCEISELPGEDDDVKVTLTGDLWDRGLLMTSEPLAEVLLASEDDNQVDDPTLTKEEAEVFADLLDAIPHSSENPQNVSSDEEVVIINDNESSNSCDIICDRTVTESVKQDSESDTSSVAIC